MIKKWEFGNVEGVDLVIIDVMWFCLWRFLRSFIVKDYEGFWEVLLLKIMKVEMVMVIGEGYLVLKLWLIVDV